MDYSTLEIRHLGSIYEGLLEYKLMVAESDLVVIGSEKERRWITLEDYNKEKSKKKAFDEFDEFDRVRIGELYLTTDKGERKATGSYYTPDYIVNYIVANTIGPVVEERWKLAEENKSSNVDATLSVKVLDPAMGSGHFLVGAVEFLAVKLMAAAQRDIEAELADDDGQFTNDWAKREAVSHCVYGVDLNDMAVELAKVSLWLTTISKEKPLSFLDHRLKKGNSLIGARLSDLMNYPGGKRRDENQTSLPSFVSPLFIKNLIGKIKELEGIEEDTLSDIKRKEKIFEEFKVLPQYTKAKAIANVHTSLYFGNQIEPTKNKDAEMVYHDMFWGVAGDEAEWRRKTWGQWFKQAQEMADQRAFFHWELEFPEIFFEGGAVKDNPGWDAVIGNPPYDELSEVALNRKIDEKNYLQGNRLYHEAITFRINLYRLFIACAIDKMKTKGRHGFIVPLSLLGDRFTFELRQKLLTAYEFQFIEAFPQKDDPNKRVFFDAKLPTCVYILANQQPFGRFRVRTHPGKDILETSPSYMTCSQEIAKFDPINFTIPLLDEPAWALLQKLASSDWLCSISEVASPMSGEVVFNETYRPYLSDDPQKTLVLRGGHIQRYFILDDPKQGTPVYIDKEKWLLDSEVGSSAFAHLNPRIVYQESAALDNWRRIIATYLPAGNICGHKICYFVNIKYDMLAFLAIFNSTIIEWRFGLVSMTNNLSAYQILAIPFPKISFTTPEPERARLVQYVKQLYQSSKFDEILGSVEACLPKDAQGNFISGQEKSDVVHDLLAFLAEQMLEMNKQKQAEIKGFLGWQEGEVGAKVEDLTPKTKIQEYHKLQFDELLAILKKNKRKIAIDPARREPQERLRTEFAASVDKLKPLMERIEATDRLIDQIVYKLYGLTEEEIRIVKGKLR